MPADIRAAVLDGIDQRLGHAEGMQTCTDCEPSWPLGACSVCSTVYEARNALRLLREEYEHHQPICFCVPGETLAHSQEECPDPECRYCAKPWPCPSIRAGAQVYAPDALKEESNRGE